MTFKTVEEARKYRNSLLDFDPENEQECLEKLAQAFIYNIDMDCMRYIDIDNSSKEFCLEAIKCNPYVLEIIKDQTPEICLEAVKEDPWALEYVKDQTPEICLEAVKLNPWALRYVKDQTPEICATAVKADSCVILDVKDLSMLVG